MYPSALNNMNNSWNWRPTPEISGKGISKWTNNERWYGKVLVEEWGVDKFCIMYFPTITCYSGSKHHGDSQQISWIVCLITIWIAKLAEIVMSHSLKQWALVNNYILTIKIEILILFQIKMPIIKLAGLILF